MLIHMLQYVLHNTNTNTQQENPIIKRTEFPFNTNGNPPSFLCDCKESSISNNVRDIELRFGVFAYLPYPYN